MTSITIVDDDPPSLVTLSVLFKAEGYWVETYSDPIVALTNVILVPPDLLILNGRMPGLHGKDFFKRYREFCRSPVIFLSAAASEIEQELAQQNLAAEAYIEKPFSMRLLSQVAHEVLAAGVRRKRSALN